MGDRFSICLEGRVGDWGNAREACIICKQLSQHLQNWHLELASESEIELVIDFDDEMGKWSCESSVKKTTFKNYLSLKLLCLLCLTAHEIFYNTKTAHINDY